MCNRGLGEGQDKAHTNQTACTVHSKSVYHRPPTHTHTVLLCYHFSFPLYLSVLSFQLPSAGCGESFANWFCRGNVFARLFLLNTPRLSSSQMIPLSLAPANSAEHSPRLVILLLSVNLQSCRGFKNTSPRPGIHEVFKGGTLLPYTCRTQIVNHIFDQFLPLKGSINKCNVAITQKIGVGKTPHHSVSQRISASFLSLIAGWGGFEVWFCN